MDHVAAVAITAIAGVPFTGVVATFNTPDVTGIASAIDWGNGHDGTGIIAGSGYQAFQISGANTFAQPGTYTVVVTIFSGQGTEAEVQATATVLAPPTNVMPSVVPAGQVSVQISFGLTEDIGAATVYFITTPAVANAISSNNQLLNSVWQVVVAATPTGNTIPTTHSIQIQITGPIPAVSTDYVPWQACASRVSTCLWSRQQRRPKCHLPPVLFSKLISWRWERHLRGTKVGLRESPSQLG